MRTLLVVAAAFGVVAAFISIGSTFLIVFVGIFLALVFEYPVRFVIAKTGLSRGLAATITVLGAAVGVTVFLLLLLVPMVGSVRDLLHDLPTIVQDLRESDELSSAGDTGAGGNIQTGAEQAAASVPDAISAVLGIAGDFFSVFLASFTILFICLFLLTDVNNLKRSLASVLMPGEDHRWLGVWERVTESVSRWAIGVVIVATFAGTIQGTTAWLLGSSYALALGVIAGLLDMIPNIGATIAGFVLVPTLWAEEGIAAGLIMLVVVLVYQQLENNIITPKVQGKAVQLSAFFIIVAVTLFGSLLGVLGALTAVPLAATLQIFIQELTKARRERVAAAKAELVAVTDTT
jgi:putative heme transporter